MKFLLVLALCALAAAAPNPRADDCAQCKQIVQYVDDKLTNNATEKEIEDFIDKICDDLGSAAEECKSYVGQYVPEVINLVASHIKPETICVELHLCNKTRNELLLGPGPVIGGTGLDLGFDTDKPIMPSVIELPEPEHEVSKTSHVQGEGCVLCEFVIKELQSILGSNATEQQIEAALEKVCDILPKTIQPECKSFINQYSPELINLLVQKLDPEQICTAIGLCSNSSATVGKERPRFQQAPRRVGDGPLCPICEQAIKYLDSLLADNATDQEILDAVERLCHYLPEADQSQCRTLIEQEGEAIIKALVDKLAPEQVCTFLRLCSSASQPAMHHQEPRKTA